MKYVFLFSLFLVLSCSNTPQSTSEKMKQKACNKDVKGFFSYVDKSQVGENLKREIFKNKEIPSNQWGAWGQALGQAMAESMFPAMLNQIWQVYEDEIKKGKDGTICKMKVLTPTPNMKSNEVLLEAPNGEKQIWAFTQSDNKWVMIALRNQAKEPLPEDRVAFSETSNPPDKKSQDEPKTEKGNYDFRKTRWGMSKEEVKIKESAKFLQESEGGNIWAYNATIANLNSYIGYVFVENNLLWQDIHSSKSIAIETTLSVIMKKSKKSCNKNTESPNRTRPYGGIIYTKLTPKIGDLQLAWVIWSIMLNGKMIVLPFPNY